MTLPVSEIFGPTIQGEGPRAGRSAHFIRLGGCNLACSWCDTPYTWDAKRFNLRHELKQMSAFLIVGLLPYPAGEVVITGGEPLIHQKHEAWSRLMNELRRRDAVISLETNGTIAPNLVTAHNVSYYSISPKLPNAGMHRGYSVEMAPWPQELRSRSCLKFVVESAEDVDLAVLRADSAGWPRDKVWVMPEGTDKDILMKRWPEICDAAVAKRINVTMRLHILAWGNERGR